MMRSSSAPALAPSNIIKSFVHQGLKNEEDLLDYRVMTVRETRRLKFIISFVSVTKAATSCDSFLRQVTKFSDDDDIPPNVLDDSDFLNSIARYNSDPVRNYADQNQMMKALRHLCAQLTSGYSPFETLGLCPEQLGIWG